MHTLKFTGWKEGAEKLSFIKMLSEVGGLSLQEAKSVKDRIVDNDEIVEISIKDRDIANRIVEEASKLGFIVALKDE